MNKKFTSIFVVANISLALTMCQQQSFAQGNLVTKTRFPPIIAQEPSSKEFQQDIEALQVLSGDRNLSGLLSATNKMEDKWLTVDKQSYYSILSEACGDLTSYDFGFLNISKQHDAVEKYAMDALNLGESMPLGMQAYFVEHLTYVPGHGMSGVTGESWSHLRSKRTALWLDTWQQIRQRTKDSSSLVLVEPKLPPRKFISQRLIIDGYVDPENITDLVERARYVAAVKEYRDKRQLIMEQEGLNTVSEHFFPLATKNIIAAYSSQPYNTTELTQLLSKSQIDSETSDEILTKVKQNIQRDATLSR